MFVAGIDQSVNGTGVCILDDKGDVQHLERIVPPPSSKDAHRLQYIRNALLAILAKYPAVGLAAMEGYSYNSTNKKFLLGEVGAVVKLVIIDKNITLMEVAPKQLKKFVTGSGSADKNAVSTSIFFKWHVDIQQNDLADAYGLAQVALTSLTQNTNNRAELEVLKNLSNKQLKKSKKRSRVSTFSNAI